MARFDRAIPHDYHVRVLCQTLSWAMGKSYHEPVIDECCPDFSCCCPELFEPDAAKRWEHYHAALAERDGKEG